MKRSSSRQVMLLSTGLCFICLMTTPVSASVQDNLRSVSGTVVSVDTNAKEFVVDIGLRQVTLAYDADTTIKGGELAAGKDVRANTTLRDGKRIATSIKIKS